MFMSKYGFNYFVSRSHLLQEMAPPTKLFGNSSRLNQWFSSLIDGLKKGDVNALKEIDPSLDIEDPDVVDLIKSASGRSSSTYKLQLQHVVLNAIQKISPIISFKTDDILPKITNIVYDRLNKFMGKSLYNQSNIVIPIDQIKKLAEQGRVPNYEEFCGMIADETAKQDNNEKRHELYLSQIKKIINASEIELGALLKAYGAAVVDQSDDTIPGSEFVMKTLTGDTSGGGANAAYSILLQNGVFDKLDPSDIIEHSSVMDFINRVLSTRERSNVAAFRDALASNATGYDRQTLAKTIISPIAADVRRLNKLTGQYKITKGKSVEKYTQSDAPQSADDTELDTGSNDVYIDAVIIALEKIVEYKDGNSYEDLPGFDSNKPPLVLPVSYLWYFQKQSMNVPSASMTVNLDIWLKIVDMFKKIRTDFQNKNITYKGDDFEKNIQNLYDLLSKKAANVANIIKNTLTQIKLNLDNLAKEEQELSETEAESIQNAEDYNNDSSSEFPYPEYSKEVFNHVMNTSEKRQLFNAYYINMKKEQAAIREQLNRKRRDINITTKSPKEKRSTPRYDAEERADDLKRYSKIQKTMDGDEDSEHYQESYTSMYMTEQVERDKLFNPRGEFKDRGFRKPLNYWHWSQND